ncbi:MAG: Ppx/GppA family phosphatase [Acidimicrobiia bacterium]|nr:Ppx/GppA family phosphatase [Acidimicrobiia bacterium]
MEDVLAAIDIGTNSFHLLVARVTGGNRFEIVAREKEMVRLGSGSGDMKALRPDAIDRGVDALRRFRQIAEISTTSIRAVATSAVREAENREEFLGRARAEAGIDIDVISGVEEARLIHLGVLQSVPIFDQRLVLIDVGGGSTEVLVGQAGVVIEARSVKLGAIRLTDRFFSREPVRRRDVEACRQFVKSYLNPVARDVRRHGFEVAVGSSGTIQSIAEMVQAGWGESSARSVGNAVFSRAELVAVVDALAGARTAQARLEIPGLDPRRADIILAGAILLEQAFAEIGIESMTVSDFALREGVILDSLQRARSATLHHLADIRRESVLHLADSCPEERDHAEHACDLALQLYDATADLHGLDEVCREHLEAAALLANVGLTIAHARHHLHSYYIIRNTEHLAGFTEREVELIAQIARYHRKSEPKAKHEEFSRLSDLDQATVRTLSGIVRLAFGLDRTHAGVVRSISARRSGHSLTLELHTNGTDPSLELYTADERKDLFEGTLGIELAFEVVVDEVDGEVRTPVPSTV